MINDLSMPLCLLIAIWDGILKLIKESDGKTVVRMPTFAFNKPMMSFLAFLPHI
jgi:hypothetical protein